MAELAIVSSMLKQLGFTHASFGMESIFAEAALANKTPLDVLDKLLHFEIDGRNERSKAKRLKAACLPYTEGLNNFK